MATRYRLTNTATDPSVSPALQSYTHNAPADVRRQLLTSDSSALTTVAYTPDAADHGGAGDSLHCQFVSGDLGAGFLFANGSTITMAVQALEAHANNNLRVQLWAGIYDSAGTTLRRELRSKVSHATEIATSLTNRFLSTTQDGTNYTTVSGDILVVEISVEGSPGGGGGVQGHNASIRWGGDGSSGDLPENDSETGTTFNPWIEFNPTSATEVAITGNAGTGAVGTLAKVVAVALTGLAATGAVGNLGKTVQAAITGNAGTGAVGSVTGAVSYSVALSGNAGTGAVGSFGAQIAGPLSGNAGAGGVGSLGKTVTVAPNGNAATGAVGTLTPTAGTSIAVSGVAGTGAVGSLSARVAVAPPGQAGTGAIGSLAPGVAVATPGNAATGAAGSVAAGVVLSLTGESATGAVGSLTPPAGGLSVALSGVQGAGTIGSLTTWTPLHPLVAGFGLGPLFFGGRRRRSGFGPW